MKEKLKIAGYAQRGVVPLALGVAVTMWLWNALIPEIVGWKAINHGQSLGLLVLLRLLFGHFGYFGRGGFGRPHMSRREHRRLHEAMRGHVAQRKAGVHPPPDAGIMRTVPPTHGRRRKHAPILKSEPMYSNEQAKNVTFRTDERMTYGAMNYDGAELMEQLLAQKVSLAQQPAVQTPILPKETP